MKKIVFIIFMSFFVCAAVLASVDQKYYEANNSHKKASVDCAGCHGVKNPQTAPAIDVRSLSCISCHGDLVELAKITLEVKPNPHDTHLGRMDCYECHNTHKPPVNMCRTCHTFPMKVR